MIVFSLSGSNDAGIFDGSTASFCLAMLILNMLAKLAAVYCFLRFYKEMEAGAIRPQERLGAPPKQGGHQSAGGRGAYDMAPMSTDEDRAPIGSPDGEKERDITCTGHEAHGVEMLLHSRRESQKPEQRHTKQP